MVLSESQIQDQILYFLEIRKIFHWRNNTGAAVYEHNGKKRLVRYGVPGMSDILGILPGGMAFAIEVKTEKDFKFLKKHYERLKAGQVKTKRDKHFAEQIAFIENVCANGGLGLFTCSVNVTEIIEKELKNEL